MELRFTHLPAKDLPLEKFFSLTGVPSYVSSAPPSDQKVEQGRQHLYIFDPSTEQIYNCVIHSQLTTGAEIFACFFREHMKVDKWPDFGINTEVDGLSYYNLGLRSDNFRVIDDDDFKDLLAAFTARAARVQVYGLADESGRFIHDIHQNSGEKPHVIRPNRPNQDGAVLFYFDAFPGVEAYRLWVCIKFKPQELDDPESEEKQKD